MAGKSIEDAVNDLEELTRILVVMKEKEESIDKQYMELSIAMNNIMDSIEKEQPKIDGFENYISDFSKTLAEKVNSIETQVDKCGQKIDIFLNNCNNLSEKIKDLDGKIEKLVSNVSNQGSTNNQHKDAKKENSTDATNQVKPKTQLPFRP